MAKSPDGVLIYKSRYGATQQYAEWIKKELRIPMIDPERLDEQVFSACDFLIIGTPVYMGEMLIKEWLWQNEQRLRSKRLILFVVCTHYADKEKQEAMINDNIPAGLLASCHFHFLPGRLCVGKLTPEDARHLGLESLSQTRQEDQETSAHSKQIYQENLVPLLTSVFATRFREAEG